PGSGSTSSSPRRGPGPWPTPGSARPPGREGRRGAEPPPDRRRGPARPHPLGAAAPGADRAGLPGAAVRRAAGPHPVGRPGAAAVLRGGPRGAVALAEHRHRRHRRLAALRRAAGLADRAHRVPRPARGARPGHRSAGDPAGGGRRGAAAGAGPQRPARPAPVRVDRAVAAVQHRRGRRRPGVRGDALPGDQRGGGAARRGPALRGGRRDPGRLAVDRVPPGHPADGGARGGRRRGARLGPGARRVRRHHHLRRELPRHDADHAARGVPGHAEQPGAGGGAQPGPAAGLAGHPHRAARPMGGDAVSTEGDTARREEPGAAAEAAPCGGAAAEPVLDARLTVDLGRFWLDARITAGPGEVVALLGPNGAGKSTALRALAGLQPLSSGRVLLEGRDITAEPVERRPIGVVFQDYLLFGHMSALENVAFGPRCRGTGRTEARAIAAELLADMGLEAYAHTRPRRLSGGQAQRVALARALAVRPRLLPLAEPLASLDAHTRVEVRAGLSRRLHDFDGAAVLVTHDPLEAMVLADRVTVLEGGGVVQEGPPAEVARYPRTDYVARLV